MSNPFVQFELDAEKKAPTLASALRIHVSTAFGGLVRMWLHVYNNKTETITAFYLRSFFDADTVLVGEALVELGFAEQVEATTWRVKGASRYTRLSDARSEAGKKGAAKTNAPGRQTVGKTDETAVLPRQVIGKTDEAAEADEPAAAHRQNVGKAGEAGTLPRQTVGKTDETAVLPRQKAALEPRAEGSLSESQKGSTPPAPAPAPAPVHARYEPDPVSHPPPDARVLVALARWQRKLSTAAPTSMLDDDSVLTVARDFSPEAFVEAVERHCEEDASFWTRTPLRYLRRRCEFAARDQAAAANAPPRTAAPRKGYVGEAY